MVQLHGVCLGEWVLAQVLAPQPGSTTRQLSPVGAAANTRWKGDQVDTLHDHFCVTFRRASLGVELGHARCPMVQEYSPAPHVALAPVYAGLHAVQAARWRLGKRNFSQIAVDNADVRALERLRYAIAWSHKLDVQV